MHLILEVGQYIKTLCTREIKCQWRCKDADHFYVPLSTLWPQQYDRNFADIFKMHLLEWKLWYLNSISTEICSQGANWHYVIIGLGNDSALNRPYWVKQRTSHYLNQCWQSCMMPYMASLGHNELHKYWWGANWFLLIIWTTHKFSICMLHCCICQLDLHTVAVHAGTN